MVCDKHKLKIWAEDHKANQTLGAVTKLGSCLLLGVIEGRKTFVNTMKYILMAISSNFGNMFSAAGAFIFLPFLPMLTIQILLENFLYDVSEFAITTDSVDE